MSASTQSSPLHAVVVGHIGGWLHGAANGGHKDPAALDDLRGLFGETHLLAALERAATDGLAVQRFAPDAYAIGEDCPLAAAATAHAFVARALPVTPPLVLMLFGNEARVARQHAEVRGVAVIEAAAQASTADLVHELAHAFLRCGHRMLDEGLAEWMAALFEYGTPQAARSELEPRAQPVPDATTLSARRWTNEPCFESLGAPAGAPHARAALTVADWLDVHGFDALPALFARVAAEQIEDVRALLALETKPAAGVDGASLTLLRRAFATGRLADAVGSLEDARLAALSAPDALDAQEAYLKQLLMAAERPDAESLRDELGDALDTYLQRDDESPLAFVLSISREAIRVRFAPDFISLNDSFQRCRALADAALEFHEDDVDVLTTVAKFEMRTPAEYGGNPRRARNLLLKAATLADDAGFAADLRRAASEAIVGLEAA